MLAWEKHFDQAHSKCSIKAPVCNHYQPIFIKCFPASGLQQALGHPEKYRTPVRQEKAHFKSLQCTVDDSDDLASWKTHERALRQKTFAWVFVTPTRSRQGGYVMGRVDCTGSGGGYDSGILL